MRTEIIRQDPDAFYAQAVKNYENAIRFFQKESYDKAHELFEKLVAQGPAEIADRARIHLQICDRKMNRAGSALKTADEYYLTGLTELNARNLEAALEHLTKALKMDPERGEIRYALAAVHALQGNPDVALEHLKTAIEFRSELRFQARQDGDFNSLAADSRYTSLVFPEAAQAASAS
ncbi:MAG TPA: tetratricopeptide repeat protein [Terriglobia bacterium]|nr:tetratricopeptide repeat protein [Terriglobia bacterium]